MHVSRIPCPVALCQVGVDLFKAEGLRGFYRGGGALLLGGGLMRSAQFGVYASGYSLLRLYNTNLSVFSFRDVFH